MKQCVNLSRKLRRGIAFLLAWILTVQPFLVWIIIYFQQVLLSNLKSPALAAQTRGAIEQFFNQTNGAVEALAVPPFASKYQSVAPVHQMMKDVNI